MTDLLWIAAIALTSAIASYFSAIVGLVCIAVAVLAALPLWALAGGNFLVLGEIILPAFVGFAGGRALRKAKATA